MRVAQHRARAGALGVALVLTGAPLAAAAQASGSLEGRVLDALSGQPLGGAEVSVVGAATRTRTDEAGRYRLDHLRPGSLDVRIGRQGYASAVERVEVSEGSTADFKLSSTAAVLDAVVIRSRGPVSSGGDAGGSSVTVRAQRPEGAPSRPSDLVASVPGARVIRGGQVGSGTGVVLRGLKSLLPSGDPVIYLNGVRVSSGGGAGSPFRRYTEPTMLDLLDPASIERIEVLPGPAAGMLYGDGAANGVILVYTKPAGT